MSVVYDYCGGLYINITNKCPNRCEFCIRNYTDTLGDADSLVLDKDPSAEDIKEELTKWDVASYDEIVFCGYGEPTERLKELLELARYIKFTYSKPVRINTNGLADLIWGEPTAPWLKGTIDSVSVSLNEADPEKYLALCHPRFGLPSYDAVVKYIDEVREYVPKVAVSVVGGTLSDESMEKCRALAVKLGVPLKIR